jgi:small subunit ribosomal protein S20
VANIKSAIKRVEINERNRLRNKSYKSAVKTLMKKCLVSVESYGTSQTPEQMQQVQQHLASAYSKIDKAVKCGALHANTGARKKSRLAQALNKYRSPQAAVEASVAETELTESSEA